MDTYTDLVISPLPSGRFHVKGEGGEFEGDLSAVIQWAFVAFPAPPQNYRLFFKRQKPGEPVPAYIRSRPTFRRVSPTRWGLVDLRFDESEGDKGIKDPVVSGTYREVADNVAAKLLTSFFA